MKLRIAIAILIGALLASAWLFLCFEASQLPVISPVSLALVFRPWWRYWAFGIFLLTLPTFVFLMFTAGLRLRAAFLD